MGQMPKTRAWLPARFPSAFVTTPVCCPSRTTILTGLYAHDSGVWANEGTYGGWPRFLSQGWPGQTIADRLQAAGYRTGLFGKFLNDWDGTIPPGWDEMAAHLSAPEFANPANPYYDYTLITRHEGRDGSESHGNDPDDYVTRVLTPKVVEFVDSTPSDQPLFLFYGVNAPHGTFSLGPPIPAPEDVDRAVSLPPLRPNVNEEDVSDKPRYVRNADPIAPEEIEAWRVASARTMRSADRSIDQVLHEIERSRDLANTLVIFLSDNGSTLGSHRLRGKGVPYEEAIKVPFRIRFGDRFGTGPIKGLVTNLDIVPTIAEAAGLTVPPGDGRSLLGQGRTGAFAIEAGAGRRFGFCGIRTGAKKLIVYATGDIEFYDLKADPFELVSDPTSPSIPALARRAAALCDPLPPAWPRDTLLPTPAG
jgi:arylsulfatase A-like enzyme